MCTCHFVVFVMRRLILRNFSTEETGGRISRKCQEAGSIEYNCLKCTFLRNINMHDIILLNIDMQNPELHSSGMEWFRPGTGQNISKKTPIHPHSLVSVCSLQYILYCTF